MGIKKKTPNIYRSAKYSDDDAGKRKSGTPIIPIYNRMPPPSALLATTSSQKASNQDNSTSRLSNPSPFKPRGNFEVGTTVTRYHKDDEPSFNEDDASDGVSCSSDRTNPYDPDWWGNREQTKASKNPQPIIRVRVPRFPRSALANPASATPTTTARNAELARRNGISIHYPSEPKKVRFEPENALSRAADEVHTNDRKSYASKNTRTSRRRTRKGRNYSRGEEKKRSTSMPPPEVNKRDTHDEYESPQRVQTLQAQLRKLQMPMSEAVPDLSTPVPEVIARPSDINEAVSFLNDLRELEIDLEDSELVMTEEKSTHVLSLAIPGSLAGTQIKFSADYMSKLRSFAPSREEMRKAGYINKVELETWQLEKRRRCNDCKQPMPRPFRGRKVSNICGAVSEIPVNKIVDQPEFVGSLQMSIPEAAGTKGKSSANDAETNENDPFAGLVLQSIELNSFTISDKSKIKFMEKSTPPPPPSKETKPVTISGTGQNCKVSCDQPNDSESPQKEKKPLCNFHPGILQADTYECCGGSLFSKPCKSRLFHVPKVYPTGEFESLWAFFKTPTLYPPYGANIRTAVALDCEMGINVDGDSELIRVTLIDFFTSEVLIDSLVCPDIDLLHYNTQYSGITLDDMVNALGEGNCILGRDQARKALWEFVGPQTAVVGHALCNDFNALRWVHGWVVDTLIIETRKEEKGTEYQKMKGGLVNTAADTIGKANEGEEYGAKLEKGAKRLKTLARAKLGRVIQNSENGHDSIEDALAARDLAHWAVENKTK